jgi:hypothetical protein
VTARRAPTKPRAKRRGGGSKAKGTLLEHCVESLGALGFHEYTNKSFKEAEVVGARYVVRGYRHLTLYGTPGSKEALIVAPDSSGLFVPDDDGLARVVMEAKWQAISGSVDEKFPFVWEAFLVSPIRNWIVVIDGPFWKTTRGLAAVAWLRARRPVPEKRRFHVVDRRGFHDLVRRAWGQS